MNFNELVLEAIHNEYVKFDIKVTGGPSDGHYFGYREGIDIYYGSINERQNVKFLIDRDTLKLVGIVDYDSFWFGPKAKLKEQALDAVKAYNPKPWLSKQTLNTFGDLIDEL